MYLLPLKNMMSIDSICKLNMTYDIHTKSSRNVPRPIKIFYDMTRDMYAMIKCRTASQVD